MIKTRPSIRTSCFFPVVLALVGLPLQTLNADRAPFVFFEPIEQSGVDVLEHFPRHLQVFLTDRVRFAVTESEETADFSFAFEVDEKNLLVEIVISLSNGRRRVESFAITLPKSSMSGELLFQSLDDAARIFAPELGLVDEKSEIDITEIENRAQRSYIERLLRADNMNRRVELGFWGGGVQKLLFLADTFGAETYSSIQSPIRTDLSLFFSRNVGLVISFLYDRNDRFYYGHQYDGDERTGVARSQNELYLPGLGLGYRTVGSISGGFTLIGHVGAVRVTAIDDLYNESPTVENSTKLQLLAGESEILFQTIIGIEGYVSINPA